MFSYKLYDMPMTPAAQPKVQASISFFGWLLVVIVAALVAGAVAFGVMFMARGGGMPKMTPPAWDGPEKMPESKGWSTEPKMPAEAWDNK
ncbi:MAG: hypothetical protein AB7K09_25045 [Planctomycetota bacterium]